MRRGPTAIAVLFVALAMDPLAVVAQSAAGWILWYKEVRINADSAPGPPTTTTIWEPVDGYDSLAECRGTGEQRFRHFVDETKKSGTDRPLGEINADGRSATFEKKSQSGWGPETYDLGYVCFPGTFDPRPRS